MECISVLSQQEGIDLWLIVEVSGLKALLNGYTPVPFRKDILVVPPALLRKGG